MAYAPHVRISFGGPLSFDGNEVPEEIWACNVNATYGPNEQTGGPINTADNLDDYLTDVAPKLATWFHDPANMVSELSGLAYVKANDVDANGRYVDQGTTHRRDFTPPVYGGASAVNPQIITTAISWGTAKARGPGSHGRIYLPNATVGTGTSMLVPQADADKLVAAGVALLQILNNSSGTTTLYPCVSSKVNASNSDIITVRVGSVKDVQRRRKNALHETYRAGVFLGAS